ncbi:MFS transporter [Fodinicola feengrottensis]|uniref:MFS transporter n=1 Tax=Fodinicola feengrottensis TaxID=435914 RepID=A0ABN2GHM2_9ACTN
MKADTFDRRLLAPMILGSVLNPVNSSIIAVSLIPIGAAFGAPPSQTAWLVASLYLATAIGQPVVGRLVDLFGPRWLFLAGTALTGLAGVVGTFAPNLPVLVIARVLLGFGTCAGYPAAMYLIRSEATRTGRDSPAGVLTTLAIATQTVAVIGPSLGGLLIGLGGWRTTLAINIPLAAVGLIVGAVRLPKNDRAASVRSLAVLDLPGMALFATMLVALLLFLLSPQLAHWYLPLIAATAAAGLVIRELRTQNPFLDVRVLGGNLPLLVTYIRSMLAYVVAYAVLFGYTQWMEEGRGLSPSQAGLAQLPLFLTGILVSVTTGRRPEIRGKLLVGATAQIVACVLLLLLQPTSPIWLLVIVAVVFGLPQGLNSLALQNAVYHQADPDRLASSAGLLRTFAYLGAMIASAAAGAFYPHRADTAGLHGLGWFMLVLAVLFLVVTAADRTLARVGRPPVEQPAPTEIAAK